MDRVNSSALATVGYIGKSNKGETTVSTFGEMRMSRSLVKVKEDSLQEFFLLTLESTNKLFLLLEGLETMKDSIACGRRAHPVKKGVGPEKLIVGLSSAEQNRSFTYDDEFGYNGRLAQLAFVGWVAEIDGNWEKYRQTTSPIDQKEGVTYEKGTLKHGQEADLMGDLHKIRKTTC